MESFKVTCPCCRTELTIDPETREILAEDRPKENATRTFEKALDAVRGGRQRREEAFSKAFDRTRQLDTVLDKKFEEAKKRASADPKQPPRPFDLD